MGIAVASRTTSRRVAMVVAARMASRAVLAGQQQLHLHGGRGRARARTHSRRHFRRTCCAATEPPRQRNEAESKIEASGKRSIFDDPVAKGFSEVYRGGSGKEIYFGVLQREVEKSTSTDAEREALRATAAEDLVNIGAVATLALGVALWSSPNPAIIKAGAMY